MCSLNAAQFGVQALSAVSAFQGQKATYNSNRRNAVEALNDTNNSFTERQGQESDAASANKFDYALEARSARATAEVAAGEAGVSGLSVEALLNDLSGRQGRFNDRTDQNRDMALDQIQAQKRGASRTARDRINSVAKPSLFDTGLRIAGAGLDAYSQSRK